MIPIQQCLHSLAVLAKTDDLNGISLAESKIDEFVRTAGADDPAVGDEARKAHGRSLHWMT